MTPMSNSSLVTYKKLSPNHSGARTHKIDTITIHCVVGHLSLQALGNIFASPKRESSSNYGVDDKGRIGLYVEEKNRSWASSNEANDQRAITIEVACDPKPPYKITDDALKGLIKLCADICRRNDIPQLLWQANPKLVGHVDKQNMTVHRWFANKSCPGDYIFGQLGRIAEEVNKNLKTVEQTQPKQDKIVDVVDYIVKVNVDTLHYRKGPGTNHPVIGIIRKGQIFTITEEAFGIGSSKWGKLKSGAGWIALDSCKRE